MVAHLSESQPDLGISVDVPRPPSAAELVPGVRVRVRGFSAPVVLRRRDESNAEVEAGPLRMKVPLGEIISIVTEEQAKPGAGARIAARAGEVAKQARPSGVTVHTAPTDAAAETDEINVIGCTVEEATERVDKFIDTAAVAGTSQVRVIHGHGKGALRRGLAEFFSNHPLIERIHAEADERGGTAVTIFELKD